MNFSAPLPWTGPNAEPDVLSRIAVAGDQLGFDFLSVGEHLIYPRVIHTRYPFSEDGKLPVDATANSCEIFTTLAFIAAQTKRIRLHSGILVLPYRSPFESAKLAATLDFLSGGRLTLGIGAGWLKEEFEILKVPFDKRGHITDEYLHIMQALFNGEDYTGRYYEFHDVLFAPKPVQKPLPIWIGGNSNAAMRRAARLAQGWQPGLPLDVIAEKKKLVDEIRAGQGREHEPFAIASAIGGVGTDRALITLSDKKELLLEQITAAADAGVTHLHLYVNEHNSPEPAEKLIDEMCWFAEEIIPITRRA